MTEKELSEEDFTKKEKPEEEEVEEEEKEEEEETKPEEEEPEEEKELEGEEEPSEEEEEKLAFPTAAVVRVMRRCLDKEKMIRKEVKIAMNKRLERMCETVTKEMNKAPYVMVSLHDFRDAIEVFETLERFQKEKERILAHMEAIKKDIEMLEHELGKEKSEILS